jgi:hypothetical protein
MRQNQTWMSKGERQHPPSVLWRRVRLFGVCLFLLVAACAPAPAVSSVTPTASGPLQRAAITAYHGHTSTVFAVAWSTRRKAHRLRR